VIEYAITTTTII